MDSTGEVHPVALDPGPSGNDFAAGFAKRYRMLDLLGAGGMGEVQLCRDGHVGRDVAMKRVRSGGEARFLREARVQGQLEHPSIVPVYDLGRDPSGRVFFTMKRVRGHTLKQILADGKQSQRKLLTAFSSVCLAVDFAHASGVVHRDLKPANVMLGDFGEVYLLDWGLAKLASVPDEPLGDEPTVSREAAAPAATINGSVLGTPGYMAPEQARGEIDSVDARSDVFALGAILFEILAGEPLVVRDVSATTDTGNVAKPDGPIDARISVRCPDRDCPPELEAVCLRACEASREARLSSARALYEALERYLDGDRDLALRQSLAERHLADAAAALALEGAGDAAARQRALSEVGRALAFDPENRGATALLMRLLTDPPRELPPDAAAESLERARRAMQEGARLTAFFFIGWFALLPLAMLMGVHRWLFLGATSLSYLAGALACVYLWRRPPRNASFGWPGFLLLFSVLFCTALLFGPFLIVPSLAVSFVTGAAMIRNFSARHWFLVVVCLGVVAPFALEVAGLLPLSAAYVDGTVVLLPRATAFPPALTPAFLLASSLVVIVTAGLQSFKIRDRLTQAQKQLELYAWQLRQLAPEEAGSKKEAQPVR
jgi:eukaryotic-like serine/threonine-protein kinase